MAMDILKILDQERCLEHQLMAWTLPSPTRRAPPRTSKVFKDSNWSSNRSFLQRVEQLFFGVYSRDSEISAFNKMAAPILHLYFRGAWASASSSSPKFSSCCWGGWATSRNERHDFHEVRRNKNICQNHVKYMVVVGCSIQTRHIRIHDVLLVHSQVLESPWLNT